MNKFHHREKDIYMAIIKATPESQWEAVENSVFFNFNFKDYPELENLVSVKKYQEGEIKFISNNVSFSSEGIVADSSFFKVFDFKLKIGNRNTVLSDPDAVLLTDQLARKMFGNENPIGKTVKIITAQTKTVTVKGIIEPLPSNSSLTFDFILPNNSTDYDRTGADFLLVRPGFNKDSFIRKIENIGHKHSQFTASIASIIALSDIYFSGNESGFHEIFSRFGDPKSLFVLYIIIGILLAISALNFSNLQIININTSLKNIGIKKIAGARGLHLFYQKLTEIVLLVFASAVLITVAYIAILPHFNEVTGVKLAPGLFNIFFVNFLTLIILIVLAMVYPTFLLWRMPIALSLKNQLVPTNKLFAKKAIISLQFSLSVFLLIASIVVARQLHLMLGKDLGFSSKNVINTKIFQRLPYRGNAEELKKQHENQQKNYQYLKNELESNPAIEIYAQGESPLNPYPMPWKLNGENKDYTTQNILAVYPSSQKLFGLELTEGRFFDAAKDKSREPKVVINEAAKKFWGIKDLAQDRLQNEYWLNDKGYEILGVVKDFNYQHLSVTPQPLVMVYFDDIDANFLIKFKEGNTQRGIKFVEHLFSAINPGEPFNYTFISDEISNLYQKEKRLSKIYIFFTLIALLISANGLFTIALYDTARRTKEIGVRKINGANISEIVTLLNRDFVKWVILAFVIATPLAYFAMDKWLESFAYKTPLSWWIFALSGLLALGIALLTVSWQSWKAATRNPVEALRYE
jgi:putative ABC transport system permease protein